LSGAVSSKRIVRRSNREALDMANKDKGGNKANKKVASQTLKQKRQAKKAKQQSSGSGTSR
jgi:hypothetical protein